MQTYENHAHRPVLFSVGFLSWVVSVVGWVAAARDASWGRPLGLAGLLVATLVALLIGRLYVTRLQDRIILLEMHVRVAGLLSAAGLQQLGTLSKAQIVALRFASDAELPALLDRASREQLKPDAIKRAVTAWRADLLRT